VADQFNFFFTFARVFIESNTKVLETLVFYTLPIMIKKTSNINIKIGLDENNVPAHLEWQADDNPNQKAPQECKAMLLSLFDMDTKDTMKIDLWTTKMQVNEMDRFFFQTLRAMADTYFKATQNREMAIDMQRFAQYFGEKTEIIPKEEKPNP
jgi:gliding motility-associated protein GldC